MGIPPVRIRRSTALSSSSNEDQSTPVQAVHTHAVAMSTKLTAEEVQAAGLDAEEAAALDPYLSDTEPDVGEDTGPSTVSVPRFLQVPHTRHNAVCFPRTSPMSLSWMGCPRHPCLSSTSSAHLLDASLLG